jgi:hypothetical protein
MYLKREQLRKIIRTMTIHQYSDGAVDALTDEIITKEREATECTKIIETLIERLRTSERAHQELEEETRIKIEANRRILEDLVREYDEG